MGFTSGQAERLCKQQPPGGLAGGKPSFSWNGVSLIQNPFKLEGPPLANVEQKRKQKVAALPETNIEDLPEAVANSRGAGAQRWYMGAASWKDIRTVPEESVLDLDEVSNYSIIDEATESTRTARALLVEHAAGQDVEVAPHPDAWPSLAEAIHGFEECELSSIASSWMDVGDLEEVLEEGDILVVTGT